jgi:hypothetical protein
MILMTGLWTFPRTLFTDAATVALENLALRHQLAVFSDPVRRLHLSRCNRIWVWVPRRWGGPAVARS